MEATELIYLTMHQERYEDLKQRILLTYGAKYDKEQEQEFSARMDFLTQLQEDTEALLDFQEPRLRYFFERHATGGSGHCCLATVLVSSFNDIRQEDLQQAAQAMEERWRLLSGPGFEISEISYSGLTYCRCPQDQTPPLHEQINRLECAPEFKWKIMTALCSYEASLPGAAVTDGAGSGAAAGGTGKAGASSGARLCLLEDLFGGQFSGGTAAAHRPRPGGSPIWTARRLRYVFGEPRATACFWGKIGGVPGEIVAYIGIIVELDDAPDGSQASDQVICSMLRAIGDNSKFSILKLLRKERMYGQEIGERLGLHHGTVSRHLSSLYRSGLVSMEKGNGRVCYYTINRKGLRRLLEVLDQVFLEEPAGPQEEEIQESLSVPGDETG